ncbi:MAG: hydroxysqualene dehydroxylase HpnE [Rubripirellula sp.]|nr:hydroxysqualene dehydroxylase HpnE [Rubripirellula sp.]
MNAVTCKVKTTNSKKRVLIVGGGLAGLATAECLARNYSDRFDISLLEAKRKTGGRAGSFQESKTGVTVDYCQHVAMGCCTNFLGLLERQGLGGQLHRYTCLKFFHPEFPVSTFTPSRWLPAPFHLMPALSNLRYLNRSQRRQIKHALFRLFRTSSDELGDLLAEPWLKAHGQDRATIGDFWSVIVVSALGESIDRVSLAAVRKVFVDGFAAAHNASDVLVPKLPLADLIGGHLTAAIEQLGVEVKTGQVVRQISAEKSIALADGRLLAADHVVSAVPWHAVNHLVPPDTVEKLEALAAAPASPISGLHLWFDRQITELPHAVLVGTVAQWVFRQPWEEDDRSSAGFYYQVVISASQSARCLPRQELIEIVLRELRNAFPQAKNAKLVQSKVVTDPQSVFSITPEFEALRPPSRTGLPWLHLAGDWVATGWPATMESAVISGRMAAASVVQSEFGGNLEVEAGLPRRWLARCLIKP